MLYVKEANGLYQPAPAEMVFAEAHSICNTRLAAMEKISSSLEAMAAIVWRMRNHPVEVFACQFLASDNRLLGYEEICSGTINLNVVHPREVVKAALRYDAAGVIFAHNHPSGNPEPSTQDIELTTELIGVLEPLRIHVFDHLIIGSRVISLADLGLLRL